MIKKKSFVLKIRNSPQSGAGFTIVELLLYMGLLSILLGVLTNIFATSIETQLETESSSSIEQDGRFIFSRLAYDLHQAQSISSPALGAPPATSLQIQINNVPYTYQVTSGDLKLTNNNTLEINSLNSLDTTVSSLTFQQIGIPGGKNTVQIILTLTSKVARPQGYETKNMTTTIGIR